MDCQGTDVTPAHVDADGYAPDADDVDDGLPYIGDDDEWIRDFLKSYFSPWGRVARLAGAAAANSDRTDRRAALYDEARRRKRESFYRGFSAAYDAQACDLRTLARILRVSGGAS